MSPKGLLIEGWDRRPHIEDARTGEDVLKGKDADLEPAMKAAGR